jgi:hypothetical protein
MTTGEKLLQMSILPSGTTLQLFMTISGGTQIVYPELIYVDITDCSAVGVDDGIIIITASGGTQPYTYSIGGLYQSGDTFINLAEGTYNISVKDSNDLIDTIGGIKLPAPSSAPSVLTPFIYNLIIEDISRKGISDESIRVFASGGTSPYMYSLNNGAFQISNYFFNLPEGTYNISVIDSIGTTSTLSGIKLSSETIITSSGGGFGRGVNRYRTKVNVKNIKVSDVDLNEGIKVRVTI